MSAPDDPFFVGWRDGPFVGRRRLLAAAVGLITASAGGGALLAMQQNPPGGGRWDQGAVRAWRGDLVRAPYPHLRMTGADGAPQTAFLATTGKLSAAAVLPCGLEGPVSVRGSAIQRGKNLMLAVIDGPDWIARAAPTSALPEWPAEDLGEVTLVGEILDAKCWFGAMRPGFGKTHKSCAALCARGGLPLAFCKTGTCGDGEDALLLLDENGVAHTPAIIPLVADAVLATGRIVRVGDVTQLRVRLSDIVRV